MSANVVTCSCMVNGCCAHLGSEAREGVWVVGADLGQQFDRHGHAMPGGAHHVSKAPTSDHLTELLVCGVHGRACLSGMQACKKRAYNLQLCSGDDEARGLPKRQRHPRPLGAVRAVWLNRGGVGSGRAVKDPPSWSSTRTPSCGFTSRVLSETSDAVVLPGSMPLMVGAST